MPPAEALTREQLARTFASARAARPDAPSVHDRAVIDHAGLDHAGPDHAGLGAALEDLLVAARVPWPDVPLDSARFVRFVAARVPADADVLEALASLHTSDLFIACAALSGEPRALEHFERRFAPEMRQGLASVRQLPEADVDDLLQVLRISLLSPDAQAGDARLERYAGTGSLGRWLRVVATRRALQLLRSRKRAAPRDELALEQLPAFSQDAELAHLKQHYRVAVRSAFARAMDRLAPRSINVLRQRFVDELTTIELGAVYGVDQSTASRWVGAAQRELLAHTRAALLEELDLSDGDCDSVLELVRSQLDISIFRHLAERA
ncbi:MAG: sigma-70 family RNA polymerase sigma factor [Myxococcales bacterium]|nr:sigma-70 family RNA polymerase sigma factor [Myxococcales bacterium]